jgi:transcriptional regulator with XRE-family HTH domain
MTGDEFKTALESLGWKQVDFCRKVGITPTTASRWASGEDIPAWVPAYLGMALDLAQLCGRHLRPLPRPTGAKKGRK